ncbi:globin [Sphingobium sp. EM0848]|uniref:globin domain-containing protein n=1 Tax=Sphingobium sp. EM0848 TaxID=2743473 RepID=UPI00159C76D0|nr:globin [Sphingobium sp. EM0848]
MTTPFARLGGEPTIAAITNHFYDLIDQDPAYAELRAIHAADLSVVRNGLSHFLIGWAGGPRDWFERGQCVMSLHRAFPVTPALADQWSAAMARAIHAQPGIEPELAQAMTRALDHMAQGMINQTQDRTAA